MQAKPAAAETKIVRKPLSVVYCIGIIIFLCTFAAMAPGWGFVTFLSYVGGVILYIWIVSKLRNRAPSDGEIKVQTSLDEDFYSFLEYSTGIVYEPSSEIKIGDKWYPSGKLYPIDCQRGRKEHPARKKKNLKKRC